MAREKPLDLAVVQTWLSAWSESEIFSDAAVRHLQSLITDPLCFVVITLSVDREPRSLVFRRIKQMIPAPIPPPPTLKQQLGFAMRRGIPPFPAMIVSPVAPVAPSVGQLWHQTGVKSETVPKLESVLWADWVIAGLVREVGGVVKQGTQVCDFQ
jgi:hypothetical protein